jgi:hypothetical protein
MLSPRELPNFQVGCHNEMVAFVPSDHVPPPLGPSASQVARQAALAFIGGHVSAGRRRLPRKARTAATTGPLAGIQSAASTAVKAAVR